MEPIYRVRPEIELTRRRLPSGETQFLVQALSLNLHWNLSELQFLIVEMLKDRDHSVSDIFENLNADPSVDISKEDVLAFIKVLAKEKILEPCIWNLQMKSFLTEELVQKKYLSKIEDMGTNKQLAYKDVAAFSGPWTHLSRGSGMLALQGLRSLKSHFKSSSSLEKLEQSLHKDYVLGQLAQTQKQDKAKGARRFEIMDPKGFLSKWGKWLSPMSSWIAVVLLGFLWFWIFQFLSNFERSLYVEFSEGAFGEIFSNYLLFYVVVALSFVLHEMGHAITCHRMGCVPGRMGFMLKFYFLPTFFVDVSDAYKLSTFKRTCVNLGGVYFQLWVLGFSIVLWTQALPGSTLWLFSCMLILANSFRTVFQLLPVAKSDGYYILSDLTGVQNLHSRSFKFLYGWIHRFLHGRGSPPPWPGVKEFTAYLAYQTPSHVALVFFPFIIFFSFPIIWNRVDVAGKIFFLMGISALVLGIAKLLGFGVFVGGMGLVNRVKRAFGTLQTREKPNLDTSEPTNSSFPWGVLIYPAFLAFLVSPPDNAVRVNLVKGEVKAQAQAVSPLKLKRSSQLNCFVGSVKATRLTHFVNVLESKGSPSMELGLRSRMVSDNSLIGSGGKESALYLLVKCQEKGRALKSIYVKADRHFSHRYQVLTQEVFISLKNMFWTRFGVYPN